MFIDCLVLNLIGFLNLLFVGVVVWNQFDANHMASFPEIMKVGAFWGGLGIIVLFGCYFVVFHSLGGQTVGKWLMGVKVVAQDGRPLSGGNAFLRLIGYLLSAWPLWAGFLWMLLDEEGRCWHDKLAGSRVIYK